jgi:transcriptional regulator with XRE-family HTH domain
MSPIEIKIRELRLKRGWSQVELAKHAGVMQSTVSELETGKARRLLDVLEKIAKALEVSPGDLLGQLSGQGRSKRARRQS